MASASRIKGRLAHGGLLLVPVTIQGQDFEFLIDTGAAYTALSKEMIAFLGFSLTPQRTVLIAPAQGHTFRTPLLTIPELQIGGFRLAQVTAILLEFPPALKLDGVLGMNVLKQFRTTIEADTATLVLRPETR
ncbi:MAG: clan AA aspartic protease [Deltaproteobacteria bacterium]|nr:clan AA aspartic protease [Deltaproteobacteria bacterium]